MLIEISQSFVHFCEKAKFISSHAKVGASHLNEAN